MESKRESESRIREMLENFEIKPSARVWEGIVSSDPAPVVRPRNLRPVWIGAAVTVVVSALLVIWYLSVDNQDLPVQVAELSGESSESSMKSSEERVDKNIDLHDQAITAQSATDLPEGVASSVTVPADSDDALSGGGTTVSATEKAGRSAAPTSEIPFKPAQVQTKVPKAVPMASEAVKTPEQQQMPAVNTSEPDTPSVTITTTEKLEIFIPNAFAPNGDGVNDIFSPVIQDNVEVSDYKMQIFARSGNLLFESSSPDIGWDGKYLGVIVEDQVCVYVITFRDSEGTPYVKRGTVTLIK